MAMNSFEKEALEAIVQLIKKGWDFAEAIFIVSRKIGLDAEYLTMKYDENY